MFSPNEVSVAESSGSYSAKCQNLEIPPRVQDHDSRRIEYLQQLQASCDSITEATAHIKNSSPSYYNSASVDSRSGIHARSKSFSNMPVSTSPELTKLMQEHDLAQSRLCGTAQSTHSHTPPSHHHSNSVHSSPQSPRTPLYPPQDSQPNLVRQGCHTHSSSPADGASLPYYSQSQMHLQFETLAQQLAQSSPRSTSHMHLQHHRSDSVHVWQDSNQKKHSRSQSPYLGPSLPHSPPPAYGPHDGQDPVLSSPPQTAAAGIDAATTSSVHSCRQQLSVVEPYITQDDREVLDRLRQGVIGADATALTPFGRKRLLYADWAASGRLLTFTESFLTSQVAPWYANVHTDVGACATHTSTMFEEARQCVAASVNAPQCDYSVLFVGSGMTAAAFKLAHLLGLSQSTLSAAARPVVMYSIMEHHSNCLLWRELDVDTVVIQENSNGLPDLNQLERELQRYSSAGAPLILGSFSAGSNVTGIAPDVHAIAALLHRYGALAAFDYASAGSCKHINCAGAGRSSSEVRAQRSRTRGRGNFSDLMEDDSLDAVMLSPHKLPGGPGSAGVLVVKRTIVRTHRPQSPGGGTVRYVNDREHWFEPDVERREEAGTPDVLGAIRAALALQLHTRLSRRITQALPVAHALRAVRAWQHAPNIQIVGSSRSAFWDEKGRLPLVSFNVVVPVSLKGSDIARDAAGGRSPAVAGHRALHPNFVAALLNDLFGIQARAGCACAGPYGHQLLKESLLAACGCSQKTSLHQLDKLAASGNSWIKPGWVRVYFSYLMQPFEVDYVIDAVLAVAEHGYKLLPLYQLDTSTGTFRHRTCAEQHGEGNDHILQNTVQSWIQGHSCPQVATKDHHAAAAAAPQPSSSGLHATAQRYNARHAEDVLAQQQAEAHATLTIQVCSAEHAAMASSAGAGMRHSMVSSECDDFECGSCTVRWFLLPHESGLVRRQPPAAFPRCATAATPIPWGPPPVQQQSAVSSTDGLEGYRLLRHEGASNRIQGGLSRRLPASEDDAEQANIVRRLQRGRLNPLREQRPRRDFFIGDSTNSEASSSDGLSQHQLDPQSRRSGRHQLAHSARMECVNRSMCRPGSAPATHKCLARPDMAASKTPVAPSAVLRCKIAATDRATAALAAGRAALAQSIHRRKQREAVSGHRCRHVR